MISVLYVDDEQALLEIAKVFLEMTGEFVIDVSASAAESLESPRFRSYDAVISDYHMPGMDGIAFLKEVRSRFGDIPFILFTGRGREEVVIEAINYGADFYLQKGGDPAAQFAELAHKLRRAVSRRKADLLRVETEKRLADIINFLPDATFAIDRAGKVIAWNRATEEMTGIKAADMLGKGDYAYAVPFYGEHRKMLIDFVSGPEEIPFGLYSNIVRNGDVLMADSTPVRVRGRTVVLFGKASPLYNSSGEITGAIEAVRDITDRKNTEDELRAAYEGIAASGETSRRIVEFSPFGIHFYEILPAGDLIFTGANPAADRILGVDHSGLVGKAILEAFPGLAGTELPDRYRQVAREGGVWNTSQVIYDQGGIRGAYAVQVFRISPGIIAVTFLDVTEQTRSETALRESEGRYRSLVESSFDGIAIHQDGVIVYANNTAARLLGYGDTAQITGQPVLGIVHPDDRPLIIARMQESPDKPLNLVHERFLRADGGYIDTDVATTPCTWKGRPAVYVTFRDISATMAAERTIRESEEKYRKLFEQINDAIIIADPVTHRITDCNRKAETLTGYSRGEMVGMQATDLVPEDLRSGIPGELQAFMDGRTTGLDSEILTRDGNRVPVSLNAAPVEIGGTVYLIAICRDMSWKREVAESIREKTEEVDRFFRVSLDLFCIADTRGYFRQLNPEWERTLGYPLGELEGKRFLDFVHPDDLAGSLAAIADLAEQKEVIGFVNRYRHRDGTYRWIEWRSFSAGERIFAAARDITRRYRDQQFSTGLSRLKEDLLRAAPLEEKLRKITDCAVSLFGADFARIWITGPGDLCSRGCIHATGGEGPDSCRDRSRCLHLLVSSGRYTHTDGGHRRVPFGAYKIGRIATGQDIRFITNDVTHDPRVHDHAWAASLGLVSFAGFRLLSPDEKPIGVFAFFSTQPVTEDLMEYLDDLATTSSQVIQTATAEEAVRRARDELERRVQERTAALRESEEKLRLKLDSVLSPDTDIPDLELANILDIPVIQRMMEDFSLLTGMGTAIVDLKGNVIEATGWQDICTKFHRANPVTAGFCTESDLYLAKNLKAGEYVAYRCRNNLWDVVTPLYIGDRHVGNIYTGQFFYDDEVVDEEAFAASADRFGFDRKEYLAALRRVPRVSRKKVTLLMDYLVRFTGFVSRLSFSNLKLARIMAEEKAAREALVRSERRLSDIINHLPDATLAIDREGKVIAWNRAMVEMTGVRTEAILGKGEYEYALPFYGQRRPLLIDMIFASREELEKSYQVIHREGDLIVAEIDLRLPDGRNMALWGKASALYDQEGARVGAIESIRDITDRRKAETELRALYSDLEKRVAERTAELARMQAAYRKANEKLNLLSGITRHDIRNQLFMLSGYLDLSLKTLPDPAKTAEFIAKEKRVADTIARQISFTKDYEDMGIRAPRWQGVAELAGAMAGHLPVGGIRVDTGDADLEIFADPLLEKVFYNLIDNALRYGGEKMTAIRITHRTGENGDLTVIVEDDGAGISSADRQRLFTKGFGKNTGLGLFLSREILAITGISITETGEPGKGARFEIGVPAGAWRLENPAEEPVVSPGTPDHPS